MKYAPYARRAAKTNLGTISIEVPEDWQSEALADNPFGEWMFNRPDGACTLYILTDLMPPPKSGNAAREIGLYLVAQSVAHRATYQDVEYADERADGGRHFRASYLEEDEDGDVRFFECQRLVDAGDRGIVHIRFILAHDARYHELEETHELRAFIALQFDIAVTQLLKGFGYDIALDPSALWRTSNFDVGNGGWMMRRPIGWYFSEQEGHQDGAKAWRADSSDKRWEIFFERGTFGPSESMSPEEIADNLLQQMLSTRMPGVVGKPEVERLPDAVILSMNLSDDDYRLPRGFRWYVLRTVPWGVLLFRKTLSCTEADATSPAGQALIRFCHQSVREAAASRNERLDDEEP
jgi:hypothetical protein